MTRERVRRASQNVSRMCLVCGVDNSLGLYPGRIHGGVASAILDETIGRAINLSDPDTWGVTIELTATYRKPVPLEGPVRAVGRITKDSGRAFQGTGEIVLDDGSVAVEARGRYLKLPIDRIASGDFEQEWFADARPHPDVVDV